MAPGRILFVVIGIVACAGLEQAFAQDNPWRVPDYGRGNSYPARPAYEQDDRGSLAPNQQRQGENGGQTGTVRRRAERSMSDRYRRNGYGTNGYGNRGRSAAASPYLGRFGFAPRPAGNPQSGYRDGRIGPGRQARAGRSSGGNVRGSFVPSTGRGSYERAPPRYREPGYGDYPPLDPGPAYIDQPAEAQAPPARPSYARPYRRPYAAQPYNRGWSGAPPGFAGPSTFGNPYGGIYGGMPGGYGYPGGLGLPMF